MPGKVFYWRAWSILARQVSTREDMGRRERSRCLDPMKKQDLVLGRDQNHTNTLSVLISWSSSLLNPRSFEGDLLFR